MKLPIVIPYVDADNGKELRYAIRTFENITNWNGEVVLIGDKPDWYTGNHIPHNKKLGNYQDVYLKLIKACELYEKFIWTNDDIYITEKTEVSAYYHDMIYRGGIHGRMLIDTERYLKSNGYSIRNYDLHTPMVIEAAKVKTLPPRNNMHWRSLYGNIHNIGGVRYKDQKTTNDRLPEALFISTSKYTPELHRFNQPSQFEKPRKKRIAALLHYYIEEHGSGGELYVHGLLKELAKKNDVTAYITDDNLTDTVIDKVKVKYKKNIQHDEFDILITHFQNTDTAKRIAQKRQIPLVLVVHNNMMKTKNDVRTMRTSDLIIYNSEWIKKSHGKYGIVLTPPIKKITASPGEKVLLVNLTPEKGADVFYEVARKLPHRQFLGVKGGYYKNRQKIEHLPNVEIIDNTPDINSIYKQAKIVLMPSSYESYGMVAAEAAQVGIPTICHPTPGLIENMGEAGIYIDRKDIDGYATEIEKLYTDSKYYKVMSDKVIQRSKQHTYKKELKAAVAAIEVL